MLSDTSPAARNEYLIKELGVLSDDQIDAAWTLYHTCMAPLRIFTPQEHLMTFDSFKKMMLDESITKGLVLDEVGGLVAFGTHATDLTAVPLICTEFYQHWWPDEYDRGAIFYVLFIVSGGVHRAYRAYVEHIFSLAKPVRGLVAVDVSDYNEEEHHFVDAIAVTTRRLSHGRSRHYPIGYQGYWMYDPTGQATYPTFGRPVLEPGTAAAVDDAADIAGLTNGVYV
jgi:hypothetical protein